jgi:hypothetical protein
MKKLDSDAGIILTGERVRGSGKSLDDANPIFGRQFSTVFAYSKKGPDSGQALSNIDARR